MVCRNCGNIVSDNSSFCLFCGSTDLVKDNNIVELEPEINNNYIESNINVYEEDTVINNVNVKEEDVSKNNNILSKVLIVLTVFIISLFSGLSINSYLNPSENINGNEIKKYTEISPEEFKDYMEDNNYKVTDLTSSYANYGYIDNFYVAKSVSGYGITYIYSIDNNALENLYNNTKKDIISSKEFIIKTNINLKDIKSYVVESSNNYSIITKIDNSIMYTTVNKVYTDRVNNIFSTLGYVYEEDEIIYNTKALIYLGISLIILLIFWIIILFKLFRKAGRRGIYSLIPIYNLYCFTDISIGNGWLFLILLIPVANILFLMVIAYKLARMFGKSKIYSVMTVLFSIIFIPFIAFDNSKYLGIKRI